MARNSEEKAKKRSAELSLDKRTFFEAIELEMRPKGGGGDPIYDINGELASVRGSLERNIHNPFMETNKTSTNAFIMASRNAINSQNFGMVSNSYSFYSQNKRDRSNSGNPRKLNNVAQEKEEIDQNDSLSLQVQQQQKAVAKNSSKVLDEESRPNREERSSRRENYKKVTRHEEFNRNKLSSEHNRKEHSLNNSKELSASRGDLGSSDYKESNYFFRRLEEEERKRERKKQEYIDELKTQMEEQRKRRTNQRKEEHLRDLLEEEKYIQQLKREKEGEVHVAPSRAMESRERRQVASFDEQPLPSKGNNKYTINLEEVNEDTQVPMIEVQKARNIQSRNQEDVVIKTEVEFPKEERESPRQLKNRQTNQNQVMGGDSLQKDHGSGSEVGKSIPIVLFPTRSPKEIENAVPRRINETKYAMPQKDIISEEVIEENEDEPTRVNRHRRHQEQRQYFMPSAPSNNYESFGSLDAELVRLRKEIQDKRDSFGNSLQSIRYHLETSKERRDKYNKPVNGLRYSAFG